MVMRKGRPEPLYLYAIDERNPTGPIVVPSAEFVIDNSVIYDEKQHKGHLLCPGCEKPHLILQPGRSKRGDANTGRDYFARKAKEEHDLHCEIGLEGLVYPFPDRRIDEKKGGYAYANIETVGKRAPFDRKFLCRSEIHPGLLRQNGLLPDWIKAIEYGEHPSGFKEIITADFVDRKRYNPVKDVGGLLDMVTRINTPKLKDTWIIRHGVAVRLDTMILREGMKPRPRDEDRDELDRLKKVAGLRATFLMAADGKYDNFARLLNDQIQEIRYPVLLHFTKASRNRPVPDKHGQPEIKFDLAAYKVENPERLKDNPHQLALPFVNVTRRVHIKDQALFDVMKDKGEFFAWAHAYMFKDKGPNGMYHQHFDIMRERDVAAMTQQELADKIHKAAEARAAHEERRRERELQSRLNIT